MGHRVNHYIDSRLGLALVQNNNNKKHTLTQAHEFYLIRILVSILVTRISDVHRWWGLLMVGSCSCSCRTSSSICWLIVLLEPIMWPVAEVKCKSLCILTRICWVVKNSCRIGHCDDTSGISLNFPGIVYIKRAGGEREQRGQRTRAVKESNLERTIYSVSLFAFALLQNGFNFNFRVKLHFNMHHASGKWKGRSDTLNTVCVHESGYEWSNSHGDFDIFRFRHILVCLSLCCINFNSLR